MVLTIRYNSPAGNILLSFYQEKLVFLGFEGNEERQQKMLMRYWGIGLSPSEVTEAGDSRIGMAGKQIVDWLDGYFAKMIFPFPEKYLAFFGSSFQQKVWRKLTEIPVGKVLSYRQLADSLGNPKAVRAVAQANARNPISLLVPCHRIIGSDGSMTGYAGGIPRKKWLLEFEQGTFRNGREIYLF